MHSQLAEDLQQSLETPGRVNLVVAWPRGFGKTTISTLGVPLWCIYLAKRHYIIITSDSSPQADAQLENLKIEVETNPRLIEDFGTLQGENWAAGRITTANDVRIESLGAGKKIRGRKYKQWRPDLILFDDIENLEEVNSPTQRESRKKWFNQTAMRAGWEDTKTLTVGNLLHGECLLADLLKNPLYHRSRHAALLSWADNMDLWDQWENILVDKSTEPDLVLANAADFYLSHKAEMDKGAVSAWPEVYSYYDLMVMRASEGHIAFATELMNNPVDLSSALFKKFHYYDMVFEKDELWLVPLSAQARIRLSECAIFGFTDPSLGKDQRSDYTAIIIIAKAPYGLMFVLEADIKRRSPDEAINAQNSYGLKYTFSQFGIETVQFQALYFTNSQVEARKEGLTIPFVGVSQSRNKELRIQSLEPDINNGWVVFPRSGAELLIEQLQWFGVSSYDDGPDALEGARTLALKWQGLKSQQLLQGETHTFDLMQSRSPAERSPKDPFAYEEERVLVALQDEQDRLQVAIDQCRSEIELQRLQLRLQLVQLQIAQEVKASEVYVPYIVG